MLDRKEILNSLRDEVNKYVDAERQRLVNEALFLKAVKDRSTGKIQAKHTNQAIENAKLNVKAVVGLDEVFDPSEGV